MSRLDLSPFEDEHVPAAGGLLADRHARHRAAEPLLAAADAEEAIWRAWDREGTSGAVALRERELVGFLFGRVAESRDFGRNAWVERAGHAATDAEVVRDLYAAAAEAWVEAGARNHFALVPVLDGLLDPWYRLGFGQMHMDAARPSGPPSKPLPPGLVIRRGGLDDLESTAVPVNRLIVDLQAASPSFSSLTVDPEEELDEWRDTLEADDVAYFVVEDGGRVVGHSVLYPPGPELGIPDDAVFLASTATAPEVRGAGIGLALTEHVLGWAQEAGYGTVVTNWRVTNLLASRFWPARGFRPTFVRLYRVVGNG